MSSKTAMVIFQPSGRRGRVPLGVSIVEASRRLGVDIEAPCGEKQVCGKCKIRIEQGSFQKPNIESSYLHAGPWQSGEEKYISPEEKEKGYRMGCVATVEGDLLIFVPEAARAGKQVVSKAPRSLDITINPAVKHERLCATLEKQYDLKSLRIDLSVLRTLHDTLHTGEWKATVTVWMDQEIVHVQPGSGSGIFGLAIDVGTTTVAAYLCDLLKRMSTDLVDGLNSLIDQALSREYTLSTPNEIDSPQTDHVIRIQAEDILDVSIAGNTAMHHILLQLNPEPLGVIPFTPSVHHSLDIKAHELGLRINPAAHIFVLPNEAGFVGGDNVGVILAEEPHHQDQIQLIIDIGTNGELVVGNKDRLICSSCATGPALEGAQIEFGMRAAPGAIERVTIDPETHEVDFKVIGKDPWRSYANPEDMKTKGICGSGILDAMAQLFLAGIIDKSGAFSKHQFSNRFGIHPETDIKFFVLAWAKETSIEKDIVITQQDVRQIQLAKASIYTGCKLMMRKLGIDRVDSVKVAGAFGSHVDCKLALVIGMFPDCAIDNIVSVGNAAGDGCRIALLNRDKRVEADWIANNVQYMELTLEENFQWQLMEAIHLPHMTDAFAHLKGILPDTVIE
jgi:uncharacterized 2Fe-2S/4Fe-4S cluster protein (DUF4445 family)